MTYRDRLRDNGFDPRDIESIVDRALEEDLGPDRVDVTSDAVFPVDATATADIVARVDGVVAGLAVAETVLAKTHAELPYEFDHRVADGAAVTAGTVLATVAGRVRGVLAAERTMLNILSRMSGVATHTRRWVDALDGTGTTILDTRKTTPGLRVLDKYAVRVAGGGNKRMGLYDVAMVKDNHKHAAGSVTAAYHAIRRRFPDVDVQVEVDTLAEAKEAVAAGATFLLCDNMTPDELREVVAEVGDAATLEATGTITLDRAAAYAATGVDHISSGALTHSSPIMDIALDIRYDATDPHHEKGA